MRAVGAETTGLSGVSGVSDPAGASQARVGAGGVFPPQETRWRSVAGDDFALRLSAAASGGAFALAEVVERADGGPPQAIHHDHDETVYILEGARVMRVGEESAHAGPGSIVFIPRGTAHSHRNVGPGPHRAMVLFTPGGLEGFFLEVSELTAPPDPAQMAALAARYGTEVIGPPLAL
jgi:mannose-6-phosphate isomerase-like protein (cupin superfamily)